MNTIDHSINSPLLQTIKTSSEKQEKPTTCKNIKLFITIVIGIAFTASLITGLVFTINWLLLISQSSKEYLCRREDIPNKNLTDIRFNTYALHGDFTYYWNSNKHSGTSPCTDSIVCMQDILNGYQASLVYKLPGRCSYNGEGIYNILLNPSAAKPVILQLSCQKNTTIDDTLVFKTDQPYYYFTASDQRAC